MRTSRWSIDAQRQFGGWLNYLVAENEALGKDAAIIIEARAAKLAQRPFDGRPSRWPSLRELSLPRWRKLLIYEVKDAEVVIIAFYDMRQDLSAVSPTPE